MKRLLRDCWAFTLVEMIVVIAIIGMLVGLLFPAISGAIRTARKARAKTEVYNLASAFRAYYTEFGYWPTNVMDSLEVTTNTFANSRNIVFYDFSLKDVEFTTARYLDPWRHPYWFRVDHDYNNSIQSPFQGDGNIAAGAIVWSMGPDEGASLSYKKSDPANRNVITSW